MSVGSQMEAIGYSGDEHAAKLAADPEPTPHSNGNPTPD